MTKERLENIGKYFVLLGVWIVMLLWVYHFYYSESIKVFINRLESTRVDYGFAGAMILQVARVFVATGAIGIPLSLFVILIYNRRKPY